MRIYKKQRTKRIKRLMLSGFSPDEARGWTGILIHGKRRAIVLRRPYVQLMMRDRLKRYKDAMKRGLSEAEFRQGIEVYQRDMGWLDDKGRVDYWRAFRHWRDEALRRGWESPERAPKPHKKQLLSGEIDREYVRTQAQRYRTRDKAKPRAVLGDKEAWIEQLRVSVEGARTPEQREQFKQQIIRLGGTP